MNNIDISILHVPVTEKSKRPITKLKTLIEELMNLKTENNFNCPYFWSVEMQKLKHGEDNIQNNIVF